MNAEATLLCPQCLRAGEHRIWLSPQGVRSWVCPQPSCAGKTFPLRYAEDYGLFPPVPVCLVGNQVHGKSAFLAGLFHQLDAIAARNRWPGFVVEPLDDLQFARIRQELAWYERGDSREGSRVELPDPLILRCHAIPRVGGSQLIFLDNGGEAFDYSVERSTANAQYAVQSSAVVWLSSLMEENELTAAHKLTGTLVNYKALFSNLGASPKRQSVVFTLTKAERLLKLPGFPASVRRALADDAGEQSDPWAKLETIHNDLAAWLERDTPWAGFANMLKQTFRNVRFCAISAQGREYDPANRSPYQPRGVLSPLFWLWRLERPGVWVETGNQRDYYLSLAEALDAAPEGAVVRVGDGVHVLADSVKLRKALTLIGADAPGSSVIRGAAGDCVFEVQASETIHFRRVVVERYGTVPGDAVRVMAGRFTAEQSSFRNGVAPPKDETAGSKPVGYGVSVGGNAMAELKACTFAGNGLSGVWGFGTAKIQLADCTAKMNKYGLLLSGGASAKAERCSFEQNRVHGIFLQMMSRLEIAGGGATANRTHGLKAVGSARIESNETRFCDNAGNGFELNESSSAAVEGGEFSGNTVGISISEEAGGDFQRAAIRDNRRAGLKAGGQTRGAVTQCQFVGNKQHGFHLADATGVCVLDCRTPGNLPAGGLVEATVPREAKVDGSGTVTDQRRRRRLW